MKKDRYNAYKTLAIFIIHVVARLALFVVAIVVMVILALLRYKLK